MNSFGLNSFHSCRDRVPPQLEALAQIGRELKAQTLGAEPENTQRDMRKGTFRFVVVGKFSRGKSTNMDEVMGESSLAPVGNSSNLKQMFGNLKTTDSAARTVLTFSGSNS